MRATKLSCDMKSNCELDYLQVTVCCLAGGFSFVWHSSNPSTSPFSKIAKETVCNDLSICTEFFFKISFLTPGFPSSIAS